MGDFLRAAVVGGWRPISRQAPRVKAEAEAAAKPSMRSTRVTRSTSSPSANGARRPPSKPGHARTPCASCSTAPRASAAAALLGLHPRAPSWDPLAKDVGPAPSRSPSRNSQVVVRRGQRWRRQMPRGRSSLRSSLRSMARRAQFPPSVRRMRVSRRGRLESRRRWLSPPPPYHHPLHTLVASTSPHLISRVSSTLAHLRCHRLLSTGTPPLLLLLLCQCSHLTVGSLLRFRRHDADGGGAPARIHASW